MTRASEVRRSVAEVLDCSESFAAAAIIAVLTAIETPSEAMVDAVAKAIGTVTPNRKWARSAIAAMLSALREEMKG